jgi:catecholate siderophore receptor
MRLFIFTLGALALSTAALAAQPASSARARIAADTTTRFRFEIPAKPLREALAVFGRQAGLRIEGDLQDDDARSHPVSGALTAPAALRQLLAGTGYAARFRSAYVVTISSSRTAMPRDSASHRLDPVVVSARAARRSGYTAARTSFATKTDMPLRDVPQAVTVVGHELIADQAMQSMADVARYIPGVTMGQGEGNRDAPTIRGQSSTADFFVDGVRDDAQYFRDVYNLERVEALKGANAMIFGRGGGGGVINRVSKTAGWAPVRAFTLEGGSYDHKRATLDLGDGLGATLAARVNAVLERSRNFRDASDLAREGVNPTATLLFGTTMLGVGYEYFRDRRTADRGIPSFDGAPSDADITTFFGNPDVSVARVIVNAADVALDHRFGERVTLRNRSRLVRYDKFYRNVFPGGLDESGTEVSLRAYGNSHDRLNLFNQTDLVTRLTTGSLRHTFLLGAELGRQRTDNVRNTGFFDDQTTSLDVPFNAPTTSHPVTFRQSATDADNRVTAGVLAFYAQHQLALGEHWQALVGLRYDRFALALDNHRNGEHLERDDDLLSPRLGLVYKPVEPVSLYASYGVSHLPSSGDQFASLNANTRTLEPERFSNAEVGAKWEPRSDVVLTAAAYRLERSNTAAPDPLDPTRLVQTGEQRTLGAELGVSGNVTAKWQVAMGYAIQRAWIIEPTSAASAGATVPLVPRHSLSLWNRYRLTDRFGAGVGIVHGSDMYAAIDNAVTLPGFTRTDAALFLRLLPNVRAQLNVENVFDVRYYPTSHGNNNIMPGAPRSFRVSLTASR